MLVSSFIDFWDKVCPSETYLSADAWAVLVFGRVRKMLFQSSEVCIAPLHALPAGSFQSFVSMFQTEL